MDVRRTGASRSWFSQRNELEGRLSGASTSSRSPSPLRARVQIVASNEHTAISWPIATSRVLTKPLDQHVLRDVVREFC
jgi:hypothetical protein